LIQSENLIFVYGTLRKDFKHPMAELLYRNAEWIGFGHINAQLFDLGDYPGIILSKNLNNKTFGDLYKLTNPSFIYELDKYEGSQYKKSHTTVFIENKIFDAMVYELIISTKSFPIIKSGNYFLHAL